MSIWVIGTSFQGPAAPVDPIFSPEPSTLATPVTPWSSETLTCLSRCDSEYLASST